MLFLQSSIISDKSLTSDPNKKQDHEMEIEESSFDPTKEYLIVNFHTKPKIKSSAVILFKERKLLIHITMNTCSIRETFSVALLSYEGHSINLELQQD